MQELNGAAIEEKMIAILVVLAIKRYIYAKRAKQLELKYIIFGVAHRDMDKRLIIVCFFSIARAHINNTYLLRLLKK